VNETWEKGDQSLSAAGYWAFQNLVAGKIIMAARWEGKLAWGKRSRGKKKSEKKEGKNSNYRTLKEELVYLEAGQKCSRGQGKRGQICRGGLKKAGGR